MATHPWLQEVRNVAAIVQASDELLVLIDLNAPAYAEVSLMRERALERLTALLLEDERTSVLDTFAL